MGLLLDTQILAWVGSGSRRLSPAAERAIIDPMETCHVSSVTAYEFADLNGRGRFGVSLDVAEILARLEAHVLPFPAEAWRIAEALPALHRDPIDRMVAAHAIHADLTLVTSDALLRQYPVRTLW